MRRQKRVEGRRRMRLGGIGGGGGWEGYLLLQAFMFGQGGDVIQQKFVSLVLAHPLPHLYKDTYGHTRTHRDI
jgi:hypothetical protein